MVILYLIILFATYIRIWSAEDVFTRVDDPENLFVGTIHNKRFFQKIEKFFLNDSSLSCYDKHLQIIFHVLNDKNSEVEAKGFLTETGGVSAVQEVGSCALYKKYI